MKQEMYEMFKLINTIAFMAVAAFVIGRNVLKKKADKKPDKKADEKDRSDQ